MLKHFRCLQLCLLLLCNCILQSMQAAGQGPKRYPVTKDDLLAAIPADTAHLAVAKASRHWRKVLA